MLGRVTRPFGEGGAAVLVTIVVIAAVAGAFAYSWNNWGHLVEGSTRYLVTEDSIEITPQPDWISVTTDVKKEVIASGLINELSTLEPQAAAKISKAFELNQWVKSVKRVRKLAPNRVNIELEYRRPVALVGVQIAPGQAGWEPVDGEGVVLPEERFREDADQLKNYIELVATPVPQVPHDIGLVWPDDRIQKGARLASLLQDVWQDWGVNRIHVTSVTSGESPTFTLCSGETTRIVWGRAPESEAGNEIKAMQKMAVIGEYLKQNGNVTKWPEGRMLDVQHAAGIRVTTVPRSTR
jgi:hypothetical protein